MRRRKFVKRAVAASAGVAAMALLGVKPSKADESLLWPHIAEPLASRRNGKPSNYREIHHCYICGNDFYCPDRWITQRCEPKAFCREKGWRTDIDSCLPCKFGSEAVSDKAVEANMIAWREAHFVNTER